MGIMPKAPKIPPPPAPPPTAPTFSATQMSRRQGFDMKSALGGTYLTAGQSLGKAKGKTLLGI